MKKGVKIGLIIAVIVIIGVVAFIIYKKKKAANNISTTDPVVDVPDSTKLETEVKKMNKTYDAISNGSQAPSIAVPNNNFIPGVTSNPIKYGTKLPGKGEDYS